ncbi:hypothetical protein C7U92_07345, partial [Bradyrhizobium sp. WBOS7]|nr:hypothetical protein [Bradyrhizobium sp. WBOS2]MDD1569931.1 hypothetical protein [Bradyrhizobium sp. WBOS1]MDD1576551.1 hypothetical protein [Bradyrhizobium sp. WBOS7]MDD1598863.1 hypothetical protein [Bradyrhizobium sp. WBOS16]
GRGSYVGAQGTGGQGGSRRIGPADQPTPTDWPPNARRVQGGQRRKAPCPRIVRGHAIGGWSGSPGKGRAIGVGEVECTGTVKPDTKRVRYEVAMRMVRRGKLVLGIADGRVLADGASVFVAKDMRVGLTKAAY